MSMFDTIVAEATAPFESALSIVRVSGSLTQEILFKLLQKNEKIEPRKMYKRKLYSSRGEIIDDATLVYFEEGKSYTGEKSLEVYVHGSRIIVNELIDTIVAYGAIRATGGEFTAKAYYNGKLSLLEAEAVNELIKAKTYEGKQISLKTLTGQDGKEIDAVREKLLELMAQIEVNIDYPEYDEESSITDMLKVEVPNMVTTVNKLCANSKNALYYLKGVKVALVGKPNVGKSTLLNALLGYDKAIVTDIPGTTRDVVEGEKNISGIIYYFYDTAGIRENPDPIEKIGISKSFQTIEDSDVVLYIFDKWDEKEYKALELDKIGKPVIVVQNKKDINELTPHADIAISALNKEVDKVIDMINDTLDIKEIVEGGFTSKRDLDLLTQFSNLLVKAQEEIEGGVTLDVIETLLFNATHKLDELLGKEQTLEDLYATVFSRFCVGK